MDPAITYWTASRSSSTKRRKGIPVTREITASRWIDGRMVPRIQSETVGWETPIAFANSAWVLPECSRYCLRDSMGAYIGISYLLSTAESYISVRHSSGVKKSGHKNDLWKRLIEVMTENGELAPGKERGAQQILAKAAKVKQPTVSEWKSGQTMPTIERPRDLALHLKICVEWLYTGRGPKRPFDTSDPLTAELAKIWARLSEANRGRLTERADELLAKQFPARDDSRELQRA